MTMLVTHKVRILGPIILRPHACELVHVIVLGKQTLMKFSDVNAALHVYPTLAQIHRRAVNSAYTSRLFSPFTRRLVRWLQRLPG